MTAFIFSFPSINQVLISLNLITSGRLFILSLRFSVYKQKFSSCLRRCHCCEYKPAKNANIHFATKKLSQISAAHKSWRLFFGVEEKENNRRTETERRLHLNFGCGAEQSLSCVIQSSSINEVRRAIQQMFTRKFT